MQTSNFHGCASLGESLDLKPSVRYRCLVRATNVVGRISPPRASDGFTYDQTPPFGGWVNDGRALGLDASYLSILGDIGNLGANWGGFSDTEYGTNNFTYHYGAGRCDNWQMTPLYSAGRAAGATLNASFRTANVGSGCEVLPANVVEDGIDSCELPDRTELCFVVRATNVHGLVQKVASNGALFCADGLLAVSGGTVQDRRWKAASQGPAFLAEAGYVDVSRLMVGDVDYTGLADLLVSWEGFVSSCAPISKYEVELEVLSGDGDTVTSWTPIAETAHTVSSLASHVRMPSDGRYRVRVCAFTLVNHTSCAWSDGVVYDSTPPTGTPKLCVRSRSAQLGCDARSPRWVGTQDGLALRWSGFDDPESGIARFEVVFTIAESRQNITFDVGLATEFAFPSELLLPHVTAMPTVVCFNSVGFSTSYTTGRLLSLDETPPVIGEGAVRAAGLASLAVGDPSTIAVSAGAAAAATFSATSTILVEVDPSVVIDVDSGIQVARLVASPRTIARSPNESLSALLDVAVIVDGELTMPSGADGKLYLSFDAPSEIEEMLLEIELNIINGAGLHEVARLPAPIVFDRTPPVTTGSGILHVCNMSSGLMQAHHHCERPSNCESPATDSAACTSQCKDVAMHLCLAEGSFFARSGIEQAIVTLWPSVERTTGGDTTGGNTVGQAPMSSQSMPISTRMSLSPVTLPCDASVEIEVRGVSGSGLASESAIHTSIAIICSAPAVGRIQFTGGYARPATVASATTCVRAGDVSRLGAFIADFDVRAMSELTMTLSVWSPFLTHSACHAAQGSSGAIDVPEATRTGCAMRCAEHLECTAYEFADSNATCKMHTALITHVLCPDGSMRTSCTEAGVNSSEVAAPQCVVKVGNTSVSATHELSFATIPADYFELETALAVQVGAQGCNIAGLCSTTSETVWIVHAPPIVTDVWWTMDGLRFRRPGQVFGAAWQANVSVEAINGVPLVYDVCVGTSQYGCQLLDFMSSGIVGQTWSMGGDALPPLQCGASYYLVVRATNCAGLQHVLPSVATTYCCERPAGGRTSLVDASGTEAHYISGVAGMRASWRGFAEPCSGVRDYEVHVEDATGVVLWANATRARTSTDSGSGSMALPSTLEAQLEQGGHYTITVSATSHAGLVGNATSAFVLDGTAPAVGDVALEWAGQLRSTLSPAASLAVCMPASVSSLRLSWVDASDPESFDLRFSVGTPLACTAEAHALCAGPSELCFFDARCLDPGSDVHSGLGCNAGGKGQPCRFCGNEPFPDCPDPDDVTAADEEAALVWQEVSSARSAEVVPFANGGLLRYAVRACNPARLCSIEWSSQVYRVASAPSGGSVQLLTSASASAGWLSEARWLSGEWTSMQRGSGDGTPDLVYDVCVGTSQYGCQLLDFMSSGIVGQTWSMGGDALPPLQCGASYYLVVRATNCAGLQHVLPSVATTYCCERPAGGRTSLVDASGTEAHYISGVAGMRASWRGFAEPCSGVRDYEVHVEDATGVVLWANATRARTSTDSGSGSMALPSTLEAQLEQGGHYTITVSATSHAGLTAAADVTSSFVVDRTPGVVGTLLDGGGTLLDLSCMPAASAPGCTWSGVADAESHIARLEWAVGSTAYAADVMNFTDVSPDSTMGSMLTPAPLPIGAYIFCSLRVTNGAGMVVLSSSDGAQLIESSCSELPSTCALPVGLDAAIAASKSDGG